MKNSALVATLGRLISVGLVLAFLLFSFLTIRKIQIWIEGDRTFATITELRRIGENDYHLYGIFNVNGRKQRVERIKDTKAYNHLVSKKRVSLLYLPSSPGRNLILDLSEQSDIIGLVCGFVLSGAGVGALIRKRGRLFDG